MSEIPEHLSEISSEPFKMSAVLEAQTLVRRIAGPRVDGDNVKSLIVKAARCLGFTYTRSKDIWYGDARRIDALEIDRLREIAGRREAELAVKNLVDARSRLSSTDPHGNSEAITHVERALFSMGHAVRPMDLRER